MSRKARNTASRTVRAGHTTGVPLREELERAEAHEHGHQAKPISLYPLDFETAIRGLLAVPWPPKMKKKKQRS